MNIPGGVPLIVQFPCGISQLVPAHDAHCGHCQFGVLPEGARAAHVDGDDAAVSISDCIMASPGDMITYPGGTSLGGYAPQAGEDLAHYLRRL